MSRYQNPLRSLVQQKIIQGAPVLRNCRYVIRINFPFSNCSGGFMIYRDHKDKHTIAIDFRETAPQDATADKYTVAGQTAHEKAEVQILLYSLLLHGKSLD